jgi:DAK2 domain fusion protein YloV
VNVEGVRELARAALANLETHRQRIDDLNVYPVPDGDTGTNLTLSVRSIVETLDASSATTQDALAKELTRAALMGARGNSGVIFSQIVRGFAEVLGESDEIDGAVLSRAFRSASDAAYAAVRNPVEGTMLSVIRELAEETERPDVRALPNAELLERVVSRGDDALARTPEQLDVLREAGVVDAGGAGLLELVRGLAAGVAGKELPAAATAVAGTEPGVEALHQELSRYRYCTTFVVEGDELDAEALERELERLGDSLLVVGDAAALKVHVHTDEPGAALALATSRGTIEGVEIANMHRQTVERERRLEAALTSVPTLETGLIAVVPGEGNRRLFERYGATRVIEGGQTMNPSTAEIVEAIEATPAAEVVVLPNNSNVQLAAEQAARLVDKPVRVVPSHSVPAGLAAMVRYLASSSPEENERAMLDALASVVTGEVTTASRDVELAGVAVRKGTWRGLADGAAVASGPDFDVVASAVVDRLLGDGREILTLLTGEDAPPLDALLARIDELHPDVEVDTHAGGQPHYPLLLSAE